MWTLIGFGGLVAAALIVLLWDYGARMPEPATEAGAPPLPLGPINPPASEASGRALSYTVTRWDLASSWLSFCFRHRTFHVIFLLGLLLLEFIVLHDSRPQSFTEFLIATIFTVLALLVPLVIAVVVAMVAMAY